MMHTKPKCYRFTLLLLGLSIIAQNGVCAEFMRGADISMQTQQEEGDEWTDGVIYKEYGVPKDAVVILKNHDFNWIRIRLFHTPTGSENGVCQDLDYVTELAARVKAAGFKFLLDIHYSDTWAGPSAQTKPAAWQSLSQSQLVTAVHDYTRDVISHLRDNSAMPEMVQIGNEIICGMLWPNGRICSGYTNWSNLAELINSAKAGVNEGRGSEPMPLIMIHIDRGGEWTRTQYFFDNLIAYGVQFDVIGQSFYPEYHGELDDLTTCLNGMAATYSQDIIVVETGEYYTDGSEEFPEDQKAFLEELIRRVQATPNGKGRGVFYWEPTWVWSSPCGYRALFEPDPAWDEVNMLMGMEVFDKIYGDIEGNGIVNLEDLHDFCGLWLEEDCAATAELDLNVLCRKHSSKGVSHGDKY